MSLTAALKSSNITVSNIRVQWPVETTQRKGIQPAPDPCDLSLSDEMFCLFSDLVYRTSGIRLELSKKGLLVSRLAKRLKAQGIRRFYDYYKKVRNNEEELVEMLNCISTNTTKFFRENHHFEYLKKVIVPELLKNNVHKKNIRIWSAGCSTGEEPYSIAITVCEALKRTESNNFSTFQHSNLPASYLLDGWDIKILATDISTRVLESAISGIYRHEQVPDEIPSEIIRKYFLKGTGNNSGMVKIKDFLKEMIIFKRFNLKEQTYPFKRKFNVIFCRNVLIYFDNSMRRYVFDMFHEHLSDNGYLFLGHSETVFDREQFVPVHTTIYKKK